MATLSLGGIAALRRFVRAEATEHCELCGAGLPTEHAHLVEAASRRLLCACEGCIAPLAARGDRRYRTVPRRTQALPDFRMTDAEWDAFQLPIDMAFIFYSTLDGGPIAFYPGPAGATRSLLDLAAWSGLAAANPVLGELEPDVEALLVNRTKGARDYYRVPIDRCYALAGVIRTHWRGLSGGTEAWSAINRFFAELRDAAARSEDRNHG